MGAYDWVFGLCRQLWQNDEDEVADAIIDMSGHAANADIDALEAIYPVVMAYAREKDIPWLELYARHTRQQAYLNNGYKAGTILPDVVETLAMTARDDMRECPQSICAIQDLSICYAAIDAPGYAEARMAALDEVMPGLDPHLGCASCLLSEKLNALCSLHRYQEALDFGLGWVERAEAAGLDWAGEIRGNETKHRDFIMAAIGGGRFDLARTWLDAMVPMIDSSGLWKSVAETKLALARGDAEPARHMLPFADFDEKYLILRRDWLALAVALNAAGQWPGDLAELAAIAERVAAESEAHGLIRAAFDSRIDAGGLARANGDADAVNRHLGEARRLRPLLRGAFGADERLTALAGMAA